MKKETYVNLEHGLKAGWTLMPLMFDLARVKEKIYYIEVAEFLNSFPLDGKFIALSTGAPAFVVGDVLQKLPLSFQPVPPLNALIVEKTSRLPSEGNNQFASWYFNRTRQDFSLEGSHRQEAFERIFDAIFHYSMWPEVEAELKNDLRWPDPKTYKQVQKLSKALIESKKGPEF